MNPDEPQPQIDYSQPIGYDSNGRPLYARPPQEQAQPPQQTVHVMRPLSPEAPEVSPEQLKKYEESKRKYPMLQLSVGEFVVSAIYRHPIGLISIWLVWGGLTAVLLGLAASITTERLVIEEFDPELMRFSGVFALGVAILAFLIGLVSTIIYRGNKFFLTNESVVQFIQTGLFDRQTQSISLENIEDASYRQTGIIQHLLNYGSLRLSTEGDETTYRFIYVARPQYQVALLNDAVEAFKNGRPLSTDISSSPKQAGV